VPIDDECHSSFIVNLAHVTGDLAQRFTERRETQRAQLTVPFSEVGRAILHGELSVQDVEQRADVSRINTQDYVAQYGQGAIADRADERLGRSDVGVILLRSCSRPLSVCSTPRSTSRRVRAAPRRGRSCVASLCRCSPPPS
jgi:hypothetical protein